MTTTATRTQHQPATPGSADAQAIPAAGSAAHIERCLPESNPFADRITTGNEEHARKFQGLADQHRSYIETHEREIQEVAHERSGTARSRALKSATSRLAKSVRVFRAFLVVAHLHRNGWVPTELFHLSGSRHVTFLLEYAALADAPVCERSSMSTPLKFTADRKRGYALMRETVTRLGLVEVPAVRFGTDAAFEIGGGGQPSGDGAASPVVPPATEDEASRDDGRDDSPKAGGIGNAGMVILPCEGCGEPLEEGRSGYCDGCLKAGDEEEDGVGDATGRVLAGIPQASPSLMATPALAERATSVAQLSELYDQVDDTIWNVERELRAIRSSLAQGCTAPEEIQEREAEIAEKERTLEQLRERRQRVQRRLEKAEAENL